MPFHVQRRGFAQLAQWLSEEGITVYASVSSLFRQFAATLRPAANFPQIRLAVLSGERVLRHDAELLRRHFSPECALLNQFGGTEMRYVADYLVTAETQFPGNIIPAGRIVEGKEVVLLDEKGRPVAPGEIGQITVRSRYLAEGYWRRPELTEAVFKPDPEGGAKRVYYSGDLGYLLPDGALVHLGRKDDMIKIKGRRIELGEVEYALHLLDGVREAAVVARQNPQGREVLVAYLVLLDPDRSPGSEGWRAALARTLPEYMLPAQFVVLSSLPLNPNGKVNRKALPDPDWKTRGRGADFLLPRNEIEERLAGIFQRVLGLSGVGVRDDFFTLGGDSLAYLSLIVEIEKEFAVSLPDQALAGAATVERMEAILDRREEEGLETPDRLRFGSEEAWAKRLAWLIRPLVALLSYERTVRWLCAIVSRQRGRWGMQGSQARLFRRFLAALGSDPPAISDPVRPDESVRRHLAGNLGHRYLCIALARTGPAGLARLVSIEGAEWFHEARRQGRGVILVSGHLNAGRLPILMLHQWGLDDLVAVGKWSADLIMMGLESISRNSLSGTDVSDSVLASQLLRGRRVLARGGVVEILGDGLSGDSREIILPFLGRLRPFKTGFAELALSTGAPVLPVAVSWRLNGEATVRFLPPLAAFGDIRQARVESLVQRLAGFLEEQWRGNPANVYWREIEYFLKLPQAGPGRAPAEGMAPPS